MGPKRFTSSIDSILGELNQCRGKIQGQSTFCAEYDGGFKASYSRSPLQLHFGSVFLSASGEAHRRLGDMKGVLTSIPIRKRFQVTFDTGIKVRFLGLRFQVIFVNGSL